MGFWTFSRILGVGIRRRPIQLLIYSSSPFDIILLNFFSSSWAAALVAVSLLCFISLHFLLMCPSVQEIYCSVCTCSHLFVLSLGTNTQSCSWRNAYIAFIRSWLNSNITLILSWLNIFEHNWCPKVFSHLSWNPTSCGRSDGYS